MAGRLGVLREAALTVRFGELVTLVWSRGRVTLLGVGLGLLIADNIAAIQGWAERLLDRDLWNAELRFLAEVPALIDWREVASVIAMAVGLSFLATIYPSWRAARLDPVEALRYE